MQNVINLQGWCNDIHGPCYHSVVDTEPSYTTRTRRLPLQQSHGIPPPRIRVASIGNGRTSSAIQAGIWMLGRYQVTRCSDVEEVVMYKEY
jgi:hypothetical protein